MDLNLDQYVQRLFPWEFTVTLGGRTYTTRPLTIGDLLEVESIQTEAAQAPSANKGKSDAGLRIIRRMRDLIGSWFDASAKPDLETLMPDAMLAILRGAIAYWQDFTKKNAALRQAATAAAEKPGT